MVRRLTKLSEDHLVKLRDLAKTVPFKDAISYRRRVSTEGHVSVYRYSKWLTWGLAKRSEFKRLVSNELAQTALVGWFLQFPSAKGFLGQMTTWVDSKMAGYVTSFNISDAPAIIIIDGEQIVVAPGEGIGFSLRHVHSIPKAKTKVTWACMMHQGTPTCLESRVE